MKKQLLTILLCFGAMSLLNTNSNAQSILVYYWNFNSWAPVYTAATAGVSVYANIGPDYGFPGTDTAITRFVDRTIPGTSAAYASYADVTTDASDTINAQMGALPGNCFRARNPDDSLELLLYMPTTGFKNLQIKYGCESSSYTSGDSINVFSYSVDSGATWISSGTGLSEWVDSGSLTFRLVSVHVNDTNANNNRKFVFRINLVGRNTGTSGNNRFDNFTLQGDSLSGVISHAAVPLVNSQVRYSIHPNPATNQIEVTSELAGNKSIIITNVIGQRVYNETANGTDFYVNVSDLRSGVYFITIRENDNGAIKTMQFTKQ